MSVTFTANNAPEALAINMNNRNAALVAEALGITLFDDEHDGTGEMAAADFQGRVLLALAVAPTDEGMPAYEHTGPGARMVEGARRPGYLQDRLQELHALATWAVAHAAEVWWY